MRKLSENADGEQAPNAANVVPFPDADARLAEFEKIVRQLTDADFEKRCPADYAAHLKAAAKLRMISVDAVRAEVKQRRADLRSDREEPSAADAPSAPVEPVDGLALLDEMRATVRRHLCLPPCGDVVVVLWSIFTHCLDAFRHSPRLAVVAPFENSGKTATLKVLARVCRRPHLTSNTTAAAIFRRIDADRPTLLLDECDTYLSGADFDGLINSGHDREAARVDRAEKNPQGEYRATSYRTWSALAMARIGAIEPASTRSRCIVINMQRARPDEQPRPLADTGAETWHRLQVQCGRWAHQQHAELRDAKPDTAGLDNRAADNWRPLFAIADAVGGLWPGLARQAAAAFAEARKPSPAEQLLAAIKRAFDGASSDALASVDLCRALAEDEEFDGAMGFASLSQARAAGRVLNRRLEPFGVRSVQWKVAGTRDNVRGFRREQFTDAFARFLPPTEGSGQ